MQNRPKTDLELTAMRHAGRILASVLEVLVKNTKAGVKSKDLSALAHQELKQLGGKPAFLGVKSHDNGIPFPDIVCISISEEVQHSIPSERIIKNGDIVNFDFGVEYQGMITDAGLTIPVGQVSSEVQHLLNQTKKALDMALKIVKAGVKIRDISKTIETILSEAKLGIVRELVGHGVGHHLHEEPEIPNFTAGSNDYVLQENQTVAIEPIATLGSGRIRLADDGWTLLSADNTYAAHFEHTIRVTKSGCEILTQL
ncbi:MAG: type I methionyl aminopeptidase [Candidatus Saccharibacteria bacterium]|nr:type I methionyl aminopeptidase [Candidatus Saccharibacteria bacterium]